MENFFLEKLTLTQPVKEFFPLYGTRKCIKVFTKTHPMSLEFSPTSEMFFSLKIHLNTILYHRICLSLRSNFSL
jgi:hypothetical protein